MYWVQDAARNIHRQRRMLTQSGTACGLQAPQLAPQPAGTTSSLGLLVSPTYRPCLAPLLLRSLVAARRGHLSRNCVDMYIALTIHARTSVLCIFSLLRARPSARIAPITRAAFDTAVWSTDRAAPRPDTSRTIRCSLLVRRKLSGSGRARCSESRAGRHEEQQHVCARGSRHWPG
jgi:hypothetical protein